MSRINPYLLLGLFSLLLFLPGISNLPVVERDEAHFAQATRQMVQTGEYFQIRFQDKTRFQKPPGINWLQAAFVQLFSDGEQAKIWPYRLPSVIGALLSVWLTFFFSRRFVHERTALLASAFLASSLLLVVETHMAVIDASLLSSVVLMQGALWIIYSNGINRKSVHWGWACIFWLAMAYGFVLKGVTPLVGVLSVAALCLFERRLDWLRGLRIFFGLCLFLVLSLAWLLLVNAAEQSNYLLQMVHKDLLPKLQGGHESHGKPPLFHLVVLPFTFWPASLFLWQGAVYAYKERHQKTVRFLIAWILPTWIFFEMMPTKLPQYVLPTFPAIALLFALVVEQVKEKPGKWLHSLQFLWGVLTVGLAAGLLIMPYLLLQPLTLINVLLFLVICGIGIACVFFAWKGAYFKASVFVLLTALMTFPFTFSVFLPQLNPLWLSYNVAQVVNKVDISDESPLLVVGFSEPGLVFYLNTKKVLFTDAETAMGKMKCHGNHLLLINERDLASIAEKMPLTILQHIDGYNYSKGKWVKLLLVKKKCKQTLGRVINL
ncbi:ArnT family glycosyltransferase [Legionella nagasakiensis]|uniref:ArnT family glycosyltransferase n=1 Tax=Legionella nagasakiensis TaxID=535290 RepID=UPI00105475B2|nr:glycosyltransferase family 39 protein [Legionella nagasakiensis]